MNYKMYVSYESIVFVDDFVRKLIYITRPDQLCDHIKR